MAQPPPSIIPVGTPGVDHAGRIVRCDNVVSLPLKNLAPLATAERRRRPRGHRSRPLNVETHAMLIKLTGGKVYDPANGINGEVRDIYVARRPHRAARRPRRASTRNTTCTAAS